MRSISFAVLAAVLCGGSAPAWNYTGHKLSAYIAYKRLSPGPKARVDAILRGHPDYAKWIAAAPAGADLGLEAFMEASVWPDAIKGDPRFWEPGSRSTGARKPLLPGFPDMEQHRNWHYRDTPIAAPGAPAPEPESPNLVTQVQAFSSALGDPYKLAWFLHLAGDAHQPLHAVSRYFKPGDTGDRGGNLFALDGPARNLHSFWDDAAAEDRLPGEKLMKLAGELLNAPVGGAEVAQTDVEAWMSESVALARSFVYTAAPKLSAEYERRATDIARARVALAGHRIAAVLNARLQ